MAGVVQKELLKILVDDAIALAKRREVEAVVRAVLGEQPVSEELLVSVLKRDPGRGWSVYLSEVEDPGLIEAIESALRRSGL